MFTITLTSVTISILINITLIVTHKLLKGHGEPYRLFKRMLWTNMVNLFAHLVGYNLLRYNLTDKLPFIHFITIFISLSLPAMFSYCVIKYSVSLSEHTREKTNSISKAYTIPILILGIIEIIDTLISSFTAGRDAFINIFHFTQYFYFLPQFLIILIMTVSILRTKNHISNTQFFSLLSLSICMALSFITLFIFSEDFSSTANTLSLMTLFLFVQKDLINIEKTSIDSIANIYETMYCINLNEGIYEVKGDEFSYIKEIREKEKTSIKEDISRVITTYFSGEICEKTLAFTDIETLPFRMEGKNHISFETVDINQHWWRFMFIRVGTLEEKLNRAIFTALMIDDEKQKEEDLIKTSFMDEMTKVYNRNAYISHTSKMKIIPRNFWYVGVDVNGLKKSNDTFGHEAGDELIKGTAECLKNAVSSYGTVYRTGGDEFIVLINATQYQFKLILEDIWINMKTWKGTYDQDLSFSLGYASSEEIWNPDISKLAKTADKRMYAHKKNFYDFHTWLNRRL